MKKVTVDVLLLARLEKFYKGLEVVILPSGKGKRALWSDLDEAFLVTCLLGMGTNVGIKTPASR
jgi:hypothetical protein